MHLELGPLTVMLAVPATAGVTFLMQEVQQIHPMANSLVLVAAVAAIPPTLAVFLTWLQQRKKVAEVKAQVVTVEGIVNHKMDALNGRLDNANAMIEALKTELQRVKESPGEPTPITAPVTMALDGKVTVETRTAVKEEYLSPMPSSPVEKEVAAQKEGKTDPS